MDGVVHAVLPGIPVKGFRLVPVRQLCVFNTLILRDELLDRLLSLGFYVLMRLNLVPGVPQELHERRRQGTCGQLARVDDQGKRFIFNVFLHGQFPPV